MDKKIYILVITLLLSPIIIWQFQADSSEFVKSDDIEIKNTLDAIVGQHLIVGINKTTLDRETKEFLSTVKPGGIILYARNIENHDRLKKLTSDLQKFAIDTTGITYYIMIDEEPFGASRLGMFLNIFPLGLPDWEAVRNDMLKLKSLGINVNLAPLADFPFNESSFIKSRIPARTPEATVLFNQKFIKIADESGLATTLKHFPGLGVFSQDPHFGIPRLSVEDDTFNRSLEIFKSGIESGIPFIMTNHAVYENIDNKPAVISEKIVTGILREQLGYKGIIISDDLSDMPINLGGGSLVDFSEQAIVAGHTLLIFSHSPTKTVDVYNKLIIKAKENHDFQEIIKSNYQLTLAFKKLNIKQ